MLHQERRPGITRKEKQIARAVKNKRGFGYNWDEFDKEIKRENKRLERWMIENYGPRCSEFLKGCIVCEKWRIFDKLKMET